jgi:hypothetical protein
MRKLNLSKSYLFPQGITPHSWSGTFPIWHSVPAEVPNFLRILRNVESLHLDFAPGHDLLLELRFRGLVGSFVHPHDVPQGLGEELRCMGNSSIPDLQVWKMYDRLVAYCRAFERDETFRDDMTPQMGKGRYEHLARRIREDVRVHSKLIVV